MRSRWMWALPLLFTVGCGQLAPTPATTPAGGFAARGVAPSPEVPAEVSTALERFTKQERRQVKARHVPLNEGRGAAELYVRLSPEDRALLVQLYRLHPRPLDAAEFPAGLVDRAYDHMATLYRFKFPDAKPLDPQRLREVVKTRCYRDGEGNVLAYESFLSGEDHMLFGKYDLKGRILKIDIETWEN